MVVTKIQRWGNSQGLRVSKGVLEQAHIAVGDEVEVAAEGHRIVIRPRPRARVRGTYKLKALVARMPRDYRTQEEDWGRPVGRETW